MAPDRAFQVFLAVLAALLVAWFATRLVDHYVDSHCFNGGVVQVLQSGEAAAACKLSSTPAAPAGTQYQVPPGDPNFNVPPAGG